MNGMERYRIAAGLLMSFALLLIAGTAFSAPPPDLIRDKEFRDLDFQSAAIGDMLVYFHQRTLGEATVQGDYVVYQFDSAGRQLIARKVHWRDDLPETLPALTLTRQEAATMVPGEVVSCRLYIISPDSPVFPIDPTPTNPCWIVRSVEGDREKVTVIDAVEARIVGYGLPPPYTAFSLTGPDDHDPCSGGWIAWYQNARDWYNTMGYSTEMVLWPTENKVMSHVQSNQTAMFYELAHGGSTYFSSGCADGNSYENTTASEIESWIEGWPAMPFAFIGSCGGLCNTGDNTLSHEFRKGSTVETATVGFCGMDTPGCETCWYDYSLSWQDALFSYMNSGMTVKDAFDHANADYPACVSGSCTRFAGDEAFGVVPVVPRRLNDPPVARCRDITVYADDDCLANASIDDGSYDPDGDPLTMTQVPPGPYPLGHTLVTLTVADDHGWSVECTGTVTVSDVTPPWVVCPASVTVECSSSCGVAADDPQLAAFFAAFSAGDNCGVEASGDDRPACFPLGATLVIFFARDAAGNMSTCAARVTVIDTTPPAVTCPAPVVVECNSFCGVASDDSVLADFFAAASATDVCDDDPDLTDDRPSCFPLGQTVVTFTATDATGNTSMCTSAVTVVDTTPPTVACELSRDVLWPANHKMSDITATITADDICDSDPDIVLVSITSNEPDNGLGDGDTPNDIQGADFGTEDYQFQLRSERAGTGDGRVYTVVYRVTDGSGNSASCESEVRVPHDMSGTALAAQGFTADGSGLLMDAGDYRVVIPGNADCTFSEEYGIYFDRIYVGNHIGVIAPLSHRFCYANADQAIDLEVAYDMDATRSLQSASGGLYPIGLHYQCSDGVDYLVPDIFALGAPVVSSAGVTPQQLEDRSTGGATASVELYHPAPNPFRERTCMVYSVPLHEGAQVNIAVYNVAGRRIRDLVSARQEFGIYEVIWDGCNSDGLPVKSGVYFFRSVIGNQTHNIRVTVLR